MRCTSPWVETRRIIRSVPVRAVGHAVLDARRRRQQCVDAGDARGERHRQAARILRQGCDGRVVEFLPVLLQLFLDARGERLATSFC